MLNTGALSALRSLLDILFPPVCPLCEEDIQLDSLCLCTGCLNSLSIFKIKKPACTVCGLPFASDAGQDRPCGNCLSKGPPFIEARSAFIYEEAVLQAIHAFKYKGKVTLAPALGRLAAEASVFSANPGLVVPVPLHKKRLKERGFNQSLLLAREISKSFSVPLDYSNLIRAKATEQQVNLSAEERKRNVAGAFEVKDRGAFKGKRVLLVDDVYTTGATIRECSKALKGAGAKVFVITLARAIKV